MGKLKVSELDAMKRNVGGGRPSCGEICCLNMYVNWSKFIMLEPLLPAVAAAVVTSPVLSWRHSSRFRSDRKTLRVKTVKG